MMSESASHIAIDTAFLRAGLLKVTQPIAPSFSAIIFSVLEIVILAPRTLHKIDVLS